MTGNKIPQAVEGLSGETAEKNFAVVMIPVLAPKSS
jgi:hypothetical protein